MVKLNVFEEITVNYLLVGHTGNEVDQLFSIVCKMLEVDITTVEKLKERVHYEVGRWRLFMAGDC